ncbi:DMT family transporter [Streptomyces sp. NBC_01622]|uniref:EamA family transporter n=1 Tax=Streptomyces sp. NBC_01622 TaxID=2975903 RepID=UPI00386B9E29|nr:DMT family transporter [Streptomyces sp. NBC_01622]
MGALLALASAVCYGIVDFAGGLLSRRAHFTVVTFLGQIGGLLLALTAAALVSAEAVRSPDLLWGALSGAGSGCAMHFLNRGLARGAMSVVVPVSAVTGVALSVMCGVFFLGDQPTPSSWLGICLTVPALWLVSRSAGPHEAGHPAREQRASADGLLASAGWPCSTSHSARWSRRAVCGPWRPVGWPPSYSCCRVPCDRLPAFGSPCRCWAKRW